MVLASELSEYLPVVILAVLALLFAVLSLSVSAMRTVCTSCILKPCESLVSQTFIRPDRSDSSGELLAPKASENILSC